LVGKAVSLEMIRGRTAVMNPTQQTVRLDVDELPELETEVAISGSCKQQEVGGVLCLGIAAGIAIYYAG
jgi:hypothetical protein